MASCKDELVLNAIFNPHLPVISDNIESDNETDENAAVDEKTAEAKRLEILAVKAAEASELEESLALFNEAIGVAPRLASLYNNRGQLLRILGDVEGASKDLDVAIELSNGRGKTGAQAYTQRALLRKRQGNEDGALEDFKQAAKLGSGFAKIHMIEANPYAAMCNKMLSEVMAKLRNGEECI